MSKTAIAILASGSGTTAEAFIRHMVNERYDFTVPLVVCNNSTADVFDRIAQLNSELGLGIQVELINGRTHPAAADEHVKPSYQTVAEQRALLEAFQAYDIDLVILLGFMKHISDQIIEKYGWLPTYTSIYQARMLNTHPGLLPATKGLYGVHVQETVLRQALPQAGQSLHMVAAGYDEGPTVFEHHVPINPSDTAEELFARVQLTEKAYIASDVAAFISSQRHYNEGGK